MRHHPRRKRPARIWGAPQALRDGPRAVRPQWTPAHPRESDDAKTAKKEKPNDQVYVEELKFTHPDLVLAGVTQDQ